MLHYSKFKLNRLKKLNSFLLHRNCLRLKDKITVKRISFKNDYQKKISTHIEISLNKNKKLILRMIDKLL